MITALVIAAFLLFASLCAACAGISVDRKALIPSVGWTLTSAASFACAMLAAA